MYAPSRLRNRAYPCEMKRGRPKGPQPARPGVTYRPLTTLEIGTLRALSEGMTMRQIAHETKVLNVRVIYRRLGLLRLKLGVFTNDELMYKVGKDRIV